MVPQMVPRVTYRLQFHEGFRFADAARIAPYLARLGISHVYASPIGTLSAFAYLVDEDQAAVNGFRLASQTYGARLAGARPLGRAKLAYQISYARQSDYHRNPNDYSADYYFADALLDVGGVKLGAGYEVLGADKGAALTSFQAPLATGFKFQGWADKFLTTPPNGLEDLYANASVNLKGVGMLDTLAFIVSYHDYDAERGPADYGSEWNTSIAAKHKRFNVMLKYADYQQGELLSARTTSKLWAQIEFVW